MEVFRRNVRREGGRKKKIKKRIFGRIGKYIMAHPHSPFKDVARYLKEEYKLEVSVKTIERIIIPIIERSIKRIEDFIKIGSDDDVILKKLTSLKSAGKSCGMESTERQSKAVT